MIRRLFWLTVGVVLFLLARSATAAPGLLHWSAHASNAHALPRAVAENATAGLPLGQERAGPSPQARESSRSVNENAGSLTKRSGLLNEPAGLENDRIFANGFEDGAGADPPLCTPTPPLYPPDGLQWGGTQTLASLPEVGADQLTQVKMQGGTWKAFSFTRADMPDDLVELNADTSNLGPGGIGADARFWSVSECPGDFRPAQPCSGSINEGPFAYFDFTQSVANTCPLDPAKTYFLNVHMGPAPCNSGGANLCAFRFQLR